MRLKRTGQYPRLLFQIDDTEHKLGSILEFVLRNNNPDINDSMREGVCEDVYAELNESFICDSVNSEFGTEFESLEDMEVYC